MKYIVIAQQGQHRYLLGEADDPDRAHILDLRKRHPSQAIPKDSVLARGYWEAPADMPTDAEALLVGVSIEEGEAPFMQDFIEMRERGFAAAPEQRLRLTHPDLDFSVEVRLREWMGRWFAVADLAGKPDVGTGFDAREAIEGSLAALGERVAQEMAASASLGDAPG